ncbi:ABC transporter substrate-binding protein [Catenuloplanes atrovinosus]|uniref:ABC-type sugar transport system substrate-binding protein n=1 Tax=Catenuloplanes atrovinosus TaxID=137266 RepID=A0AAE4CGF3_9ACTN|nr:ABC transporter substrate-binding protein [Catenuloplanes atrovinosus]MDR7280635.1 ABC-type sugar transport system substrate-binding protein [Catenuloplanes atrovinosus]
MHVSRRKLFAVVAAAGLATSGLAACGDGTQDDEAGGAAGDTIVLGFAQVGAESGWRTANTKSIQDSAKAAGIDLKFSDAQQKQENQIKNIRSYITQKVDVIAFSPVVESGWEPVLREAKEAGIPVVLTDRAIDSPDTSLYVTFLGSDFIEEGKRAANWLVQEYQGKNETVNIVELQGTTGSAPAIDRKEGFAQGIAANPNFKIIASQTGEFTRAKGKEVMQAFLQSNPDIDVLYAHNDDMALGAIQAIEEAGKKPGVDIKIISIDGVKDAFQAMVDGKINVVVECNPLLGPQLMDVVKKVVAGETVEKRILTEEGVFTQDQAAAALPNRQY